MSLTAQRQRLARLRRLERMRAIHHREAMVAAGMAESTLAQLQQLAQRTEALAGAYAARTDAVDGAALAQIGAFRTGLGQITRTTSGEIDTARRIADARAADVAAAERRRSAVADRIAAEARALAVRQAGEATPLGAARAASDDAAGDGEPCARTPAPTSGNWHGS